MFVRFVVGNDSEDHRQLTGVITEARHLRDTGRLDVHEADWLEDAYAWFNAYLPCPPFSSSGWPKSAVSWFKDCAGEPIKRMWQMVSLLQEHGIPVRLLQSKNPGRVLYEDEYQVVVEEWKQI